MVAGLVWWMSTCTISKCLTCLLVRGSHMGVAYIYSRITEPKWYSMSGIWHVGRLCWRKALVFGAFLHTVLMCWCVDSTAAYGQCWHLAIWLCQLCVVPAYRIWSWMVYDPKDIIWLAIKLMVRSWILSWVTLCFWQCTSLYIVPVHDDCQVGTGSLAVGYVFCKALFILRGLQHRLLAF